MLNRLERNLFILTLLLLFGIPFSSEEVLAESNSSDSTQGTFQNTTDFPVARLRNKRLVADISDGESSEVLIKSRIIGTNKPNHYRYKFGESGLVSCDDSLGYSAYTRTRHRLSLDITLIRDGSVTLCLLAAKSHRGSLISEQPLESPTSYTWIKDTGNLDTTPPDEFNVLAPSGSITTDLPLFIWEPSNGADFYNLTVATSAACDEVVSSYDNIVGTSFQLSSPLMDGVYYGCVTASDNAGNLTEALNTGMSFSVHTIPPVDFMILSPIGAITDSNPTVTWEMSSGAYAYDLSIAFDSQCLSIVESATNLLFTSYTVSTLGDGVYYICVTAKDENGLVTTALNSPVSFEVTSVRITKHTIFTTENLLVVEFDGGFPPGSGGFASVEGADWNCTFNASNAGLITGWNGVDLVYHAVISDINNPVKDRIEITSPVYNTNGDLVANNAEDMWDGSLVAPIGYSERGVLIPGTSGVWTGSLGNGTSSFDNCNDWDIQGEFAVVGYASQAGISWLAGGVKDCGRSARLYCISPPIEIQ